jgi:putative tricarboxylic transport membrane protein
VQNGRSLISADRLTALILIGIFIVYGLEGHALESSLGVDVVGPGFLPSAIAVLGIAAGAVLLFSTGAAPKQVEKSQAGVHLRALVPVGVMLIYVLSLQFIGYPIATFAFLALMFRYFGAPSWWRAVLFALAATAIAVVIFVYGLHVRLPRGMLVSFW